MPADAVIHLLDSYLFRSSALIDEADDAIAEFSKYCICPNICESFDGEWFVLIELGDQDRAIWRSFVSGVVGEVELPAGYYDRVINMLVDWFHSESGFHPLALDYS